MITLYHDYTSPTSAVAVARAHRLAAEGLPIQLVGFEAIGVDMTLPVTVDVLGELDAVSEAARAEGLALSRPDTLPVTGLAHVAEDVAQAAGRGDAWRAAAYRAYWEQAADLADRSVLLTLAAEIGLDTERTTAALDDRLALAAVRQRTGELRREGIGGVPTLLAHRTLVPGLLPEDDLRALAGP
ncbi:DsbA family oxidoreductase [Egibacter rhizosphaerae]|uniref:DsbA family oxidoreductase n=1 Tax=Egibacter rhizosphaerae TaxID=1670831 RepID=UPI0013F166A8|nr:DsbA family protein [Egibacter rhizosphaerae]